jgi:phosphoribosylamine-glycine ligase
VKFVVASAFYSGLGFAVRLQEEGHEVLLAFGQPDDRRTARRFRLVGNGLVPKRALKDVITKRTKYRDWIFIWDENHSVTENELLRSEGFRVFGGGAYADRMEHDRQACLELVGRYGLNPPPSHPFERAEEALRFVQDNGDRTFVYKPDRGESYETWIPVSLDLASANEELTQHLRSLNHDGSFILQERKEGIEANVEVWFVGGEPRFAFMTLEVKRRLTGDLGDFCGCAFDFAFAIPLDSRAVRESVGLLFPVYREMGYTGFGDANVIIARDGVWFLEKCERFGYNAHPNLLWNINQTPLGETLAALVDGSFQPNMKGGFGAACTMYMDHPEAGKVIQYPTAVEPHLYFMDVYREGDAMLTAGYNELVLIVNGHGDTITSAWDECIRRTWQVRFPGRAFRVDGAGREYPSSPIVRYEQLASLGFL